MRERAGHTMKFSIEFSIRARENLEGMRKRDQQIVVDAIEGHLADQPDRTSRKRKQLEENPLAPWELRVSDLRVFYDIHADKGTVVIVAIGHKTHDELFIGGERIDL